MRPSRRLPSHRTLSYRTLSQRMLKTVALLAAVFACAMAVWLWRDPLALVHAADVASAERARVNLLDLIQLGDAPPVLTPVLVKYIAA